jgi:hypothetical protein
MAMQGIFLPLRRHPFCRYDYGWNRASYLPAMAWSSRPRLLRHAFLLMHGASLPDRPPLAAYRAVLPF